MPCGIVSLDPPEGERTKETSASREARVSGTVRRLRVHLSDCRLPSYILQRQPRSLAPSDLPQPVSGQSVTCPALSPSEHVSVCYSFYQAPAPGSASMDESAASLQAMRNQYLPEAWDRTPAAATETPLFLDFLLPSKVRPRPSCAAYDLRCEMHGSPQGCASQSVFQGSCIGPSTLVWYFPQAPMGEQFNEIIPKEMRFTPQKCVSSLSTCAAPPGVAVSPLAEGDTLSPFAHPHLPLTTARLVLMQSGAGRRIHLVVRLSP